LIIDNNQLPKIPKGLFNKCSSLLSINFSNNQLSEIPDGLFDYCHGLSIIYFDNNKLSQIPKRLFDKCPKLFEINFGNNQLSKIKDGIFDHCPGLSYIYFDNNKLSKIPKCRFSKCPKLFWINFSNNQLCEIPDGLFDHCSDLSRVFFDNNQLFKIPKGLFDKCTKIFSISFSNNQLSEIPDSLFDNCKDLSEINFNQNHLSKISDHIFDHCLNLSRISFNMNQLSEIPKDLFNKCPKLLSISFSNNLLSEIPDSLFGNCKDLKEINFNQNQLSNIPDGLFNQCQNLSRISFNHNQLFILQDRIFDKCIELNNIDFSNNQLAKIPRRLFKNCHNLFKIDFSNNRIKMFHDDLLSRCDGYVQSFNFEKNNIEAVSFSSLKPLTTCSDINFTDNLLYNSKSLYSSMFQSIYLKKNGDLVYFDKGLMPTKINDNDQFKFYIEKYTNSKLHDSNSFYIFRNLDKSVVEKCFLAFYLSVSSKTYISIESLQSKFNQFLVSGHSLLDLFISVFGEIDDSKIINLKKLIDQLILKDTNLKNVEFLIRSEKSISQLCTRNISCHFETFFPNTFNELLSRVRQTNSKSADFKSEEFKSEEEKAFKSFCNYVAIKKEPSKIIFHLIDYTKCFNIALEKKNLEIAKFVVILLRYYVMVWSDFENVFWIKDLNVSKRDKCSMLARDALNKFNRNLFDQFEYIFENDLNEIVMFLMDIKKLDLLKPEQKKIEFLEYDLDRFNSKQTNTDYRIERSKYGQKRTEFLEFVRDNGEILKHDSVKQVLSEKWREKEAIQYYFDLLVFIVFVVFFTIYIESEGKTDLQQSARYISLIIACINLLLEVLQCMMHIVYRKFTKYITRYVLEIKKGFHTLFLPVFT